MLFYILVRPASRDAGWGDMGAQRHEAQGAGMEGTERYTNAFTLGTVQEGLSST